jgi:hypothetical protein
MIIVHIIHKVVYRLDAIWEALISFTDSLGFFFNNESMTHQSR